jgi:hypothetical protein
MPIQCYAAIALCAETYGSSTLLFVPSSTGKLFSVSGWMYENRGPLVTSSRRVASGREEGIRGLNSSLEGSDRSVSPDALSAVM